MENELNIKIDGDLAYVYTPYCKKYIDMFKEQIPFITFLKPVKCWVTYANQVENVRKVMKKCFGKTDEDYHRYIDVEITLLHDITATNKPLFLMSKMVAIQNMSGGYFLNDKIFEIKKGAIYVSGDGKTLTLKKNDVFLLKNMNTKEIIKSNFYEIKII